MRVLGLSGSLRGDSSNHALLRAIPQAAPDCAVEVYDGIAVLPHFSPDRDVEPAPADVARLRSLVREADALVVSSPEYAHGMPGSLKNALDWLVSGVEIVGKPTLVWSASPSGALHAHPQLVEVLRTMSADVLVEAALQVTGARRAFDADGRLVDRDLERTLAESLARLRDRLAASR
ncbi:MAG: NADPH-dependent FMN reductase [Vicinamibacteria bacterium]